MANETASKSQWKTICERGNMALQFHVLSSEGQRYQLLSPHLCAHQDVPRHSISMRGGSRRLLESRIQAALWGPMCASACAVGAVGTDCLQPAERG